MGFIQASSPSVGVFLSNAVLVSWNSLSHTPCDPVLLRALNFNVCVCVKWSWLRALSPSSHYKDMPALFSDSAMMDSAEGEREGVGFILSWGNVAQHARALGLADTHNIAQSLSLSQTKSKRKKKACQITTLNANLYIKWDFNALVSGGITEWKREGERDRDRDRERENNMERGEKRRWIQVA